MKREIKKLIQDLKEEVRGNAKNIKAYSKMGHYTDAAHFQTVNGTVEFMILRLENLIK